MLRLLCYRGIFGLLILIIGEVPGIASNRSATLGTTSDVGSVIETWQLPTNRWAITPPSDYSYCRASFFSDRSQKTGMVLEEIDSGAQLAVIGPQIRFREGTGGGYNLTIKADGGAWQVEDVFYSDSYHSGERSASHYFFFKIDRSQLDMLAASQKIEFNHGKRIVASRALSAFSEVVARFNACRDAMIERGKMIVRAIAGLEKSLNRSATIQAPLVSYYLPSRLAGPVSPFLKEQGYADLILQTTKEGSIAGCAVDGLAVEDSSAINVCSAATSLLGYKPAIDLKTNLPIAAQVKFRFYLDLPVAPESLPARNNLLTNPGY